RQPPDARVVAERQRERTTKCCRVVILTSAGHAQVLHLDRATLLGERGPIERHSLPRGQRAVDGSARSGRTTKPGAQWEVTGDFDGDAANTGSSDCCFSER